MFEVHSSKKVENLSSKKSNKESIVIKNTNFWKHSFNGKYYIVPLIAGLISAYYFSKTGEEIISKIRFINTLIGIIAAIQLKEHLGFNFGLFIIAVLFSGIVMAIAYLISLFLLEKIDGDSGKRQKIISDMLDINSKMPMMLNDQVQIVKYSSPNNKTVTMHVKFVNYAKSEILVDYSNSISQFELEMLKDEQKTSCSQANLKNLFSMGLELNIEYLGKNNNIVGKINLNKEKCELYW